MPFETDKFAKQLRDHAKTLSQGRCATAVRKALEAGGADTTGHPEDAKSYRNILLTNGFRMLNATEHRNYKPLKGDIVIIQATSKGNPAGHIQAYDGVGWVSDFVQHDFWPGPAYRKEQPSYAIYRP